MAVYSNPLAGLSPWQSWNIWYVVAVDISSGISADTGEVLGLAFKAEHTITFSFEKDIC